MISPYYYHCSLSAAALLPALTTTTINIRNAAALLLHPKSAVTASSSNHVKVWYQLVDDKGHPFMNSQVWALSVSREIHNFELCNAIFNNNQNKLKRANVDASDLKLFASLDDVINLNKQKQLKSSSLVLTNPDSTADDPIYVVVVAPSTYYYSSSAAAAKEIIADNNPQQQWQRPGTERRKRWQLLNHILAAKNKKSTTTTTITITTTPNSFSGVTWADIEHVYRPILIEDFEELIAHNNNNNKKPFPQDVLDNLHDYLTKAGKAFGFIIDGNDAKRLHFIAPILIHVSNLFDNGEIQILVDEVVHGRNIHGNWQFQFVLQISRNNNNNNNNSNNNNNNSNKRICIVEVVKRDDMQQGLVQTLLGCEAVADVHHGLDCVYGIVTNYLEWIFVKSLDDRIERSAATLELISSVSPPHHPQHLHYYQPSKSSLAWVAGCIYAMLSES